MTDPHIPTLRPTAGALIQDEAGRILLIRRADDGTWGLPGGGVDAGESWREAAERECLEEIGWRVEMTGILGIYSDPDAQTHIYPDGRRVHFLGVVFRGVLVDRVTPPGPEVAEMNWFALGSLPVPIFGPDMPTLMHAASGVEDVHID